MTHPAAPQGAAKFFLKNLKKSVDKRLGEEYINQAVARRRITDRKKS